MIPSFRRAPQALSWLGQHALAIVTSRSVVVVSTTCAILYSGLWVVGVLQANGLVSTPLPIAVGDAVILRRSGAQLRQAAVGPAEILSRQQGLAVAQRATGPASDTRDSRITLEIQTSPPLQLWVIDSADEGTGTNPESGLVRLQVPESAYSGKGSDPQLVSIPHASGTFRIQLTSTQNGHFDLRVRAFVDEDVDHATAYAGSGEIFQNTVLESQALVAFNQEGGQAQLDVTPVRVLLAPDAGGGSPSPAPVPPDSLVAGAQTEPSPSTSPDAGVSPATDGQPQAPVVPAPVLGPGRPAPAPPARPAASPAPAVFRPQPVASLPIPLPVPELPANAAVDHQD
jgi:hypothetical protein